MTNHRLEALLAVAERVTVDLVAQEPVVVYPDRDTPAFALHISVRENFDLIPLGESDGRILRYVRRTALRDVEDWIGIETEAIGMDDIVGGSSPILDLLDRFSRERPLLFVFDRRAITGIATVFDLNQPAAHQFAFSLALVVEAELGRAIETAFHQSDDELDRDLDERMAEVICEEGVGDKQTRKRVRNWRAKLKDGDQLRLLSSLVLYDKIELVSHLEVVSDLAQRCRPPYGPQGHRFVEVLHTHVRGLRNAVAHDSDALTDEWQVWEWLRATLRIAQDLAASP